MIPLTKNKKIPALAWLIKPDFVHVKSNVHFLGYTKLECMENKTKDDTFC